ncbi:MAG: DUF6157 family protein [Thermomicrobiales bacterium]
MSKSTNYFNTFIEVAEDCPAPVAEVPQPKANVQTVASLQHEMIAGNLYTYTSDDVLFDVHATRQAIAENDKASAREAFFNKDQACLRASPLGKRHGWGIHHNADGRVALVAVESSDYRTFVNDEGLKHLKAMRSKRAT